jgi:glycosyltransferase involved in cell wall biosynthesis
MNILVITQSLWPEGSGGELATYLYIDLLTKNGVNVKVALASNNLNNAWARLSIYNIPTTGYGKYAIVTPFALKKLERLINWADIVYFTGLFALIPLIKCKYRKPIVVHLHSTFPACSIGTSYNLVKNSPCTLNSTFLTCSKCITFYEQFNGRNTREIFTSGILNSTTGLVYAYFLEQADAVVFVSEFQRALVLRRLPSIAKKSSVIYNLFPELRHTSIEGNDVGYFGGISLLKGFPVLMRAWSKIYGKHNSRLHISLADKIRNHKKYLESLKIIPYTKLSGSAFDEVYQNIRVVSVPSLLPEALPYMVSEACLRGRLVIASAVGGIPEQVTGLKGVRLVKPNDPEELANAIDWALSMDRNEATELGLRNHEGLLKKLNNYTSVSQLIEVFKNVQSCE